MNIQKSQTPKYDQASPFEGGRRGMTTGIENIHKESSIREGKGNPCLSSAVDRRQEIGNSVREFG